MIATGATRSSPLCPRGARGAGREPLCLRRARIRETEAAFSVAACRMRSGTGVVRDNWDGKGWQGRTRSDRDICGPEPLLG
jgi:hypothetical protein